MKKILTIIGTRPEAIKLAPVINELKKRPDSFESIVGVTGQHDELLHQIFDIFKIKPQFDLRLMKKNQDLTDLTASILCQVGKKLSKIKPDLILIQGDTTTVLSTALAAFYQKIKIGHVEAGLRTNDRYEPFPEEINRQLTDQISEFLFAPTKLNQMNLINAGISPINIYVTGNTVIDALLEIASTNQIPTIDELPSINDKMILITAHRRESFGEPFVNICKAIRQLAEVHSDFQFIYPVHPNPNVKKVTIDFLSNTKNVYLIRSLNYLEFVYLLKKAFIILTDSGGVQEEAPSLNKPVLVLRNKTERSEILQAGGSILVGTTQDKIISNVSRLIEDKNAYQKMINIPNPYGDGKASKRIVEILNKNL